MKKYSVIIPIYNAEKYLNQCISSLLRQNCEEFELILVNDCSTDNSYEICKQYENKDTRVLVLNQETNKGVSAARNRGIDCASGEYILFVDSDDFVTEDYFDTLDLLTGEEIYQLFLFGHYNYSVSSDGKIDISKSCMDCNIKSTEENAWEKLFLKTFFASPWNRIFLRSVLLKYDIRFDVDCVCYEDYLFNVEYCKHIDHFKIIKRPLYYYRQFLDVNHVSKRKWGKRFEISEKVAKITNDFIDLKSTNENLSNLRRYTYQAFLVELEAAILSKDGYKDDLKKLVNNMDFILAINSISPCGKKLNFFKLAKKLHLNRVCEYILESLI